LFDAPDIPSSFFIGRDSELKDIAHVLQPQSDSSEQMVLILGGMGGIGKTQLAIAYAKRHHTSYTSIFWLNAKSERTLKVSLQTLARRILPLNEERRCDDEEIQVSVARWLSEQENTRWLLAFDNYDEPE
jgi:Cdc6-like AAA superfamily ATPase